MGKRTASQRKGSSPKNRAPSHRHEGVPGYPEGTAVVKDIVHATGRNTPLAEVVDENGKTLMIAAEGLSTGDEIEFGGELQPGNIRSLGEIPEGVPIFNVEASPGDNGQFARSGGSAAFIVSKGDRVVVRLPSKKTREFNPECRATIGTPAGGGRTDKPFIKAGARYYYMKSRGKQHAVTSPDSMNAVDHPFGGKTKKGRPMSVSRNAPPGAKVGSISPKSSGKKKRKK